MNLRSTLLVSLLLALTCSSCLLSRRGVNEPLDPALVSQLRPGETTAQEAVELLGAPNEVVQLGYRTAYRYERQLQKGADLFLVILALRNLDTRQDRMWLFFNEEEVLTHVGSSFEADNTRYKLPWSKLY